MRKEKLTKIIFSLLIAIFIATPLVSNALPSLDEQIDEIERRLTDEKNDLSQKKAEVSDMKSQVAIIDGDLANTQSNINSLSSDIKNKEEEIEKLNNEIKASEEKIAQNKESLKDLVRILYEKGDLETLEFLASATSLSDLIDAEEYNIALQDKVNTTITETRELKIQLASQKEEQESKKSELESQMAKLEQERQNQLAQKRAKDALLAQAYSEQRQLEQTVKISESTRAALIAQRRAMSGGGEYSGGTGGYPYSGLYPYSDAWGFYQRECVSYASWYWNAKLGKSWYNTQPGRGSAKYWPEIARTLGYSVSSTPRVGAIMVWTGGTYGHVAIVENVYSNSFVRVSDYNYYFDHNYGVRDMSTSGAVFIY